MPSVVGPGCVFSTEELVQELRRMGVGKAADTEGMTVELLKWGGPVLIDQITRLLSEECQSGLPAEWNGRRVVPLYKYGPKDKPSSYRTVMVANTFSKVLGRLLEARLDQWCEAEDVRAPTQGGFRKDFSTLDHLLVLRVLSEKAKRLKQLLYILFIDFSKAFDTVSRHLLWERLVELNVPEELVNIIARLYQAVKVKIGDQEEIESTLGVIQGCPLSPTLFGLFIDKLFWDNDGLGLGVELGEDQVHTLLFVDDVALLAKDGNQLICNLEQFCVSTGMKVNVGKTQWMRLGTPGGEEFVFQGQTIDEVKLYRYLGLEMTSSLAWNHSIQKRVGNGFRALYAMWSKCEDEELVDWILRKHLFKSLVQSTVLYAAPIWGPSLTKTGWKKVESVQKTFIQTELGVRKQIPYSLLLAETGGIPLEVEALIQTLQFVARLRRLGAGGLSYIAYSQSHDRGWFANVCQWASSWGFPEERWGNLDEVRTRVSELAIKKMWETPTPRQCYYIRDVNTLSRYQEQSYLREPFSRQLRRLVARYRRYNLTVCGSLGSLLDVRGLSDAVIQGCSDLWRETDMICLTETWEEAKTVLDIPNFRCVKSVWNARKGRKGRGHGGIAIWICEGLNIETYVEHVDTKNQFVCIKLIAGNESGFIITSYFAPAGAPV
ncbi:hypothetical protein R1sor_027174 [Riccia sorocarpa]|uniref:Reverse transcriptase domain-containing protein n=1 Tax=Riccia sorocarpa TaxID=122646 RepID=A0ABD3GEZ5_9MARC